MKLGIIGGTGLYEMKGLKDLESIEVSTPFGPPSDAFVSGKLAGAEVVFLARHGRGHRKLPSEINHRANIFGFKKLGVSQVIGVSAVGSLREDFRPRDVVLPDQYFDRTKKSLEHTFFGGGIVAHITFADPLCSRLRGALRSAAEAAAKGNPDSRGTKVHAGGIYVNMEGPAFSTRAESNTYRKLGFDIIGMTSLAEAKLCREAEICYASMAMVTDYDCWHETEESVTIEMIIGNLQANTALAHETLRRLAERAPKPDGCECQHALRSAIITAPEHVPQSVREQLAPIIGKYVK